jgi:hypothetical protein
LDFKCWHGPRGFDADGGQLTSKLRTSRYTEFGELGDHSLAVRCREHVFVDKGNTAVHADVERPAGRKRPIRIDNTVSLCHFASRVAQEWVVDTECARKRFVRFGCIDTDREMGDVEGLDLDIALTERLALGGSAVGERFREPHQHYGLAATVVG